MEWKVIEVDGMMSSEKASGTAKQARDAFEAFKRAGTSKKLVLRDDKGEKVDQFEPEVLDGEKGITGKPVRERPAPLPPYLLAEAARIEELKESRRMREAMDRIERRRRHGRVRRAIRGALRWALGRVS